MHGQPTPRNAPTRNENGTPTANQDTNVHSSFTHDGHKVGTTPRSPEGPAHRDDGMSLDGEGPRRARSSHHVSLKVSH